MKSIYTVTSAILFLLYFLGACSFPEEELDEQYTHLQIAEWNDDGSKSREWRYNSSSELEEYTLYTYGSDNLLTSVEIYNSENAFNTNLISLTNIEYNDVLNPGLPTDRMSYNGDDTLTLDIQTTYNTQGMVLTHIVNDVDADLVSRRIITYDESGYNYLTNNFYENDVLIDELTCEYNDDVIDETSTYKQKFREYHLIHHAPSDGATLGYDRDLTYLYYWDLHNRMYMQEKFDAVDGLIDVNIFEYIHGLKHKQYHYHKGILSSYHVYSYESQINYGSSPVEDCDEHITGDLYYTYVDGQAYLKEKIIYEYYRENGQPFSKILTYTYRVNGDDELSRGNQ